MCIAIFVVLMIFYFFAFYFSSFIFFNIDNICKEIRALLSFWIMKSEWACAYWLSCDWLLMRAVMASAEAWSRFMARCRRSSCGASTYITLSTILSSPLLKRIALSMNTISECCAVAHCTKWLHTMGCTMELTKARASLSLKICCAK